jgi:CheY-like chemotaxis protein
VLIIEDVPDAAESLKDVVELYGHEVQLAFTGPEGIAKAHEFHPDVVLCDVGLPSMGGYAVARAMRADPDVRGAYLVALSGYAFPEDIETAHRAGFDAYLAKPPDLEALAALLANPKSS